MSKLFIIMLFIILIICWGIQGLLTYYQTKNIKENYKEIYTTYNENYFFGMGMSKGYMSKGCMIFIVVDTQGKIIHSRILIGRTVFDKFKIYDDIVGENMYSYIAEETNSKEPKNLFSNKNKKLTPIDNAVLMASKNIDMIFKQKTEKIDLKEC